MILQCKGKDLDKVPVSKLEDRYYASIKYDGHYVQIHYDRGNVRFFTSGGKEFYHDLAAAELAKYHLNDKFILEAEFIADTDGKLGSRGKAAKLTTYRTNFEKGLPNSGMENDKFMVFDIITPTMPFSERLKALRNLGTVKYLKPVEYLGPLQLSTLKETAKTLANEGYEGIYLKSPNHLYLPGKRVNNAIKLKARPTADIICIDVEWGEGKYTGMIGSLILQDSEMRIVKVGSGLSDFERARKPEDFIGHIIEIEYEQILDTYTQPVYKCIRTDKEN